VRAGDELARLYAASGEKAEQGEKLFLEALTFAGERPQPARLVLARVDKNGVEYL
jgi:hypothetical protein